jgi:hypothetical protein
VSGIAHFANDREEGGRAGVGEYQGGASGDGVGEGWMVGDLVIGVEYPFFGCGGRAVLDADSDRDSEDLWKGQSALWTTEARGMTYLLSRCIPIRPRRAS